MCYLSAWQQLLYGCDNAAKVGRPGSSTWHKLSRGIYQPCPNGVLSMDWKACNNSYVHLTDIKPVVTSAFPFSTILMKASISL